MSKALLILVFIISSVFIVSAKTPTQVPVSGAPPYGESEEEVPDNDPLSIIRNWQRPEGPAKVGVQIGHYKNNEVPEELERLRNNTGSSGGGKWEWEVNYDIAHRIAENLKSEGVEVDILPATVPPAYWADVFIAIHADGSEDRKKSGYKFAGPWRDYTKKSDKLVSILERHYEKTTGLQKDENISRNMRGYYAFSWWRNEHAIHPMTTGVIAETGFLTNWSDQQLLIKKPDVSASAISEAIIEYLKGEELF